MNKLSRRRFLEVGAWAGSAAAMGSWAWGQAAALPPPDLLIQGGTVIDPANGIHGVRDVLIRGGVIRDVGRFDVEDIRDARGEPLVIPAAGKLVVPGLVDLHAHVGGAEASLGLQMDDLTEKTGVTTYVSAGDVGAPDWTSYRRDVLDEMRTRVFAMIHISDRGLLGFPEPEMVDMGDIAVDRVAATVAENRDIVLGIKVRESVGVVGENGLEPLRMAIKAAERAGGDARVMCHIGNVPGEMGELLNLLRPGDIVTHSFSGKGVHIIKAGRVVPEALEAKARGVLFDVGHGGGSFDFDVAERAMDQGLVPDTISSDLHQASIVTPGRPHLPWVMSKFLQMGMSLDDVVAKTTARPAQIINRIEGLGTLSRGAPADVTVLDKVGEPTTFIDTMAKERIGDQYLRPMAVVQGGQVVA